MSYFFQVIRIFYVETFMIRQGLLPANWYEIKENYLNMKDNMSPQQNLTVTTDSGSSTNVSSNATMDIGQIIEKIKVASLKDDRIEILWSATVAIFVLFGMIGAFASGKFADFFGRYDMLH